jgi:hypothetical protein
MVKGSCLCGAVSFEVDTAGIVLAVGCFCVNCRKVSGSQFGVYLQVRPDSFRFLSGEENVAAYESSPGNRRGFCKTCGCVAPINTAYGVVRVPAGALDEDPGIAPEANLFAQRKAAWCTTERAKHNFSDAGTPDFWQSAMVRSYRR